MALKISDFSLATLQDGDQAPLYRSGSPTSDLRAPLFTPSTVYGAGRTGEVPRTLVAHAQDIVNIKDFGAVGDNSTLNDTAIAAAVAEVLTAATRKVLWIPAGEFRHSGTLDLRDCRKILGPGLLRYTGTGVGIQAGATATSIGTATSRYDIQLQYEALTMANGTVGVQLFNFGGRLVIPHCQFYEIGLYITPASGQALINADLFLGKFTTNRIGVKIEPSGTGYAFENRFTGGGFYGGGWTPGGLTYGIVAVAKFSANSWFSPDMESMSGGCVLFEGSSSYNRILSVRMESSVGPIFNDTAGGNVVSAKYGPTELNAQAGIPYSGNSRRPNFVYFDTRGPAWVELARIDYRSFTQDPSTGEWTAPGLFVSTASGSETASVLTSGQVTIDTANETFQITTKAVGFKIKVDTGQIFRVLATSSAPATTRKVEFLALDASGVKLNPASYSFALLDGENGTINAAAGTDWANNKFEVGNFDAHDSWHKAAHADVKTALVQIAPGTYRELRVWGLVDYFSRPLPVTNIADVAVQPGDILKAPSFAVSGVPSASAEGAGSMILVTNGASGNPVFAISDGTNWLRCDTLAGISSV